MNFAISTRQALKLFLGIGAFVFFAWFVNRYIIAPRAAGPKVDISLTPSSGEVVVGEERTVDVVINPAGESRLSGVDLELTAQNIELIDVGTPTVMTAGEAATFTKLLSHVAEDGSSGRSASVLIETDEKLPQAVRLRVVYRATAPGSCSIRVNQQETQIVGNVEGNVYGFGQVQEALYNCSGEAQPAGPAVEASFEPDVADFGVGEEGTYKLLLGTQDAQYGVSGFDVTLAFDPSLVEVVSVDEPANAGDYAQPRAGPPPLPPQEEPAPTRQPAPTVVVDRPTPQDDTGAVLPNPVNFTKLVKDWDNSAGTIRLVYVVIAADDELPTKPAVPITLRGKTVGEGTMTIVKAQVTGNVAGDAFGLQKSEASYRVGVAGPGTEAGQVRVDLKLRLQGIGTKPPDRFNRLAVKCTIADGALSQPVSSTADFVADDRGVWGGSLTFNGVSPGGGYKVICKGPKHLAKKSCEAAPTERVPGSYGCGRGAIPLAAQNSLDFTGIVQLVGDLGPTQDGWVTAYDIAAVRNNFGATDDATLAVCDLNLDGSCNTIDHALVIAALEVKSDEQ